VKRNKKLYEPIIPKTKEWPVVLLSRNRKQFIKEVSEESILRIKKGRNNKNSLLEEIETTLYREKQRIKRNPWKVDPADENEFWGGIQNRLSRINNSNGETEILKEEILKDIVSRYTNEITGNFKPSSYRLARSIVTFGFRRLLNASRLKGFSALWSGNLKLRDKINIVGEVDQLRSLARIGTIVMVPTHFSNLDSILSISKATKATMWLAKTLLIL